MRPGTTTASLSQTPPQSGVPAVRRLGRQIPDLLVAERVEPDDNPEQTVIGIIGGQLRVRHAEHLPVEAAPGSATGIITRARKNRAKCRRIRHFLVEALARARDRGHQRGGGERETTPDPEARLSLVILTPIGPWFARRATETAPRDRLVMRHRAVVVGRGQPSKPATNRKTRRRSRRKPARLRPPSAGAGGRRR